MITYKLKINFQDPRVLTSDMEFVTGDVGAYRLECEFYDNGKRYDVTNKLLTVRSKRADGMCYSDNGEIVDNTGVFVPKNSMYAVPGELYLEIALSDSSGNYVTTKMITVSVLDGIGEIADGAQDDVSIYVTLLAQIKAQIDEANELIDESNALIDEAQISFDEQFTQLESELSEKADKQTSGGGFVGGSGSETGAGGASIGVNASSGTGGSAGHTATTQNGGAMGNTATSTSGFAGGARTNASTGAAVGADAKAGAGFSGGYQAAVSQTDGAYIDAIQLGTGTNQNAKTLQVYNYQLMNADGKIPQERIPDISNHFVLRGSVADLDALPESKSVGDVYIVNSEQKGNRPYAYVSGGIELFTEDSPNSGYYQLSDAFVSAYGDYVNTDTAYLYNPDGSYWGPIFYNAPAAGEKLNGLNGYIPYDPAGSYFRFYVCAYKDLKISNSMYVWSGTSWDKLTPDLWCGNVTDAEDLPASPAPGTYCYVENDILNGVKYTGKASDLFSIYNLETLTSDTLNFTPPEYCVEPVVGYTYDGLVYIYDESGAYAGYLSINPQSGTAPPFFSLSELGVTSADDTVTFYLGIYDGTSFPASIKTLYPADSMIFWNGTKWCGTASASSVGDIEAALDSILAIQNSLIGGGSE